jgi:hypothetical protein
MPATTACVLRSSFDQLNQQRGEREHLSFAAVGFDAHTVTWKVGGNVQLLTRRRG